MSLSSSQEEFEKYMNMSEKQFLLQIANREVELEFKEVEASNRISIKSLESLAYARYKKEVDADKKKEFKRSIIRVWQMGDELESSKRSELNYILNYDEQKKIKDSFKPKSTGRGCMVSITFLIIVSSLLLTLLV